MSRTIHLGALAAVMLLGCQPTLRENYYLCTVATIQQDCPAGMACLGGLCTFGRADAGRVDAPNPVPPDASVDAPANFDDTAVRQDAFVRTDAQTGLSEGTVCATSGECASGLCGLNSIMMTPPQRSMCQVRCESNTECGPDGWCFNSGCVRACDPVAQDCAGDLTCQGGPAGGPTFICALTVSTPAGSGSACLYD